MTTNQPSKTQIKALAVQGVNFLQAHGRTLRPALQAHLGLDDEMFEAVAAAMGRRVIRARGQNGGFFPA